MRRRLLLAGLALLAAAVVLGLVFAGSPTRLADGVTIAGVDVGGLEAADARTLLERKASTLAVRPVVFVAAGRRFSIEASELGVQSDWRRAVDAAERQGAGFGPLRGFKRLGVDVFGADVTPQTTVLNGALQYELGRIAAQVERAPQDAALVRTGFAVTVDPSRTGVALDRSAAAKLLVRELSALSRSGEPVPLPLRITLPKVRAPALAASAAQARIALSAPVTLALGPTRWIVPRTRLAQLLELPSGGETEIRIGGGAADDWFMRLGNRVARPATDATWAVNGPHVRLVPGRPGVRLDVVRSADALLAAALHRRHRRRVAALAVETAAPALTTAKARSMGIVGLVSSYTTFYGGVANRIHNVEVVAHLVDDKLIAPGTTFSFNKTTGERNAAKGFLVAPVIVNGEVTTGLGGGVCQVSTTVFNAAYEAGVKITDRTNHALYISHYPQGRDATVNYPDVDLRFVNDTGHWLLLRTFVGTSSLDVSLYGTPTGRKVVSATSPLVVRGRTPVKKTVDRSLKPGEQVIDSPGEPALTTSVTRDVYLPNGKLLYHDVWYSSYRSSPELLRVGPKKKAKPGKTPTTTTQTTTG